MNLEPGDVLLFAPNGLAIIPRFIRLIQGNRACHCAIVTEYQNGVVTFVESDRGGGRVVSIPLVDLSDYGEVQLFAYAKPDMGKPPTADWSTFVYDAVHSVMKSPFFDRYSYITIFDRALDHFIGLFSKAYKPRQHLNPHGFTCSYFVASCYDNIYGASNPNWCLGNRPMSIWEPDDFTKYPWQLIAYP